MIYQSCVLFLVALFVTYILSKPAIKLGEKVGLIDSLEERKIKKRSLVRIGGLSIIISLFITYTLIILLSKYTYINYPNINNFLLISIIISLSSFLIGLSDDVKNISPFIRLIMQTFIATFIWIVGIRIENIDISFLKSNLEFIALNRPTSLFLTIFWICGFTNAINWIDGLDGLASSLVGIGSLAYGILCINHKNTIEGLILIGLSGSCFGFLILNRYPAKLLMGDGGSYLLGFNLGYLSILGSSTVLNTVDSTFTIQKLHIFSIIFAIPIFDMLYVILIRLFNRVSPFYPDNNHIHHRFLKTGLSQKKVVDLLFISNIFLCSLSLFLFYKKIY